MNIFTHQDYQEYVNIQYNQTDMKTHHGKRMVSWVSEDMLVEINKLLHSYIDNIETMVCHGCRNGFEVNVFQNLNPNTRVFGTDLYEFAYKYDRNYFRKMDFDMVPEDWRGYFDVIYSNSIDHSRDPVHTLLSWWLELKENGICFITFQFTKRQVNMVDCFNLSVDKYKSEIEGMAKENWMEVVYCSEPNSINHRRGYFVNVILRKLWT